jgi:hypothetical protein
MEFLMSLIAFPPEGKINNVWLSLIYDKHNLIDGYTLRALDTNLNQPMIEAMHMAGHNKLSKLEALAKFPEIIQWTEKVKSILSLGEEDTPVWVHPDPDTVPKAPPLPALILPEGLNTLTHAQLALAFDKTILENNGVCYAGISETHIKLEDSLPWFEIDFNEKMTAKKAKDFCQKLADTMNIRIIFNRIEADMKECTVFGVMDIEYEDQEQVNLPPDTVLQALSRDGDWAEFMEDYGTPVLPTHTKKKPTPKKPNV